MNNYDYADLMTITLTISLPPLSQELIILNGELKFSQRERFGQILQLKVNENAFFVSSPLAQSDAKLFIIIKLSLATSNMLHHGWLRAHLNTSTVGMRFMSEQLESFTKHDVASCSKENTQFDIRYLCWPDSWFCDWNEQRQLKLLRLQAFHDNVLLTLYNVSQKSTQVKIVESSELSSIKKHIQSRSEQLIYLLDL